MVMDLQVSVLGQETGSRDDADSLPSRVSNQTLADTCSCRHVVSETYHSVEI